MIYLSKSSQFRDAIEFRSSRITNIQNAEDSLLVTVSDDEINQSLNISNQFENEVIFNDRVSKSISSTMIKGKLKVFSFNQRKTEFLDTLLNSKVYEKLIDNLYDNLSVTLQKFIVYKDRESLVKDISDNSTLFFNNIDNISKSVEINSTELKSLNYSNTIKDFLKTGSSDIIGKITNKANSDLRNIINNRVSLKEDVKLTDEQNTAHFLKNRQLIDNVDFQKSYLNLNTRPEIINSENEKNIFIYNTDKMISQFHINYMLSEKFLSSNTVNLKILPEDNTILFLEDYPILEIGTRLTNSIDFNKYFSKKGTFKTNLLKKDLSKKEISLLDFEDITARNTINNSRYVCYQNLYETYFPVEYSTSNNNIDINNSRQINSGLIRELSETGSNRTHDENLSNVIFLTDCRIKYGSTDSYLNEDRSIDIQRDLTEITPIGEMPVEYFLKVGERYKSKFIDEDVIDYNNSFVTFHDFRSNNELDPERDSYTSTKILPFTNSKSLDFNELLGESSLNTFQDVFQEIKDDLNECFGSFYSHNSSRSRRGRFTLDFLSINTNEGPNNSFSYENNTSFTLPESQDDTLIIPGRKGYSTVDAFSNINKNTIDSLSYLQNIILFFEKFDRVIKTYSINRTLQQMVVYAQLNSEVHDSKKKSNVVKQIKEKLKDISKNISSAIKSLKILTSRINSLNYESLNEIILTRIGNDISNNISPYFQRINRLLERLFNRFVKLEDVDNSLIMIDGDFNLKSFILDFDIHEQTTNFNWIESNNALISSDPDSQEALILSNPSDFDSFMSEKVRAGEYKTFKNRIVSGDLYKEGNENYRIETLNIGGRGTIENHIDASSGSLSCSQQFLWSENPTDAIYPRVYDYINNSITSLLEGSENSLLVDEQLIAGQFRDITYSNSVIRETEIFNTHVRLLNNFLNENLSSDDENFPVSPINCILDVHAYKYDESINKRVNKYLRTNYIEPCNNSFHESLKIDFVNCLNSVKKEKLKKNDLNIEEVLPLSKKLYQRSIDLMGLNKSLAFTYGNIDSENTMLSFNDDEIKTLIQENIFTNNFRKSILIDDNKIKTTDFLSVENVELEGDFSKTKEDLLKISSLYYGNNSFKNNKTLFFRILQSINAYVKNHSDNWNRNINVSKTELLRSSYSSDNHPAYYDKENKKYFINFQYDSFISKLFSEDISFDESKEYIKRLVSYCICKETPFENKVTSLSEIKICNESLKTVFDEDVSEILKIDNINSNSKDINEFLFTNKSLSSVLKYNILEFKNPRETYVESNVIFDENRDREDESRENYYETLYPLNIWSYKNFSQDKISFMSSGYDYQAKNTSFFEDFIDDQKFIYKGDRNFYVYDNDNDNTKLNIPNLDDVNITKNISIKKLFESGDDELLSQVSANNIDEKDKTKDFVYKFRTSMKDKFWLGKSYPKSSDITSSLDGFLENPYKQKETNPSEELINSSTIREYNHDIPGTDLFYFASNSENKSIIYFFNNLVKELIEYYDIDIEQFEDYDQIIAFLEGESSFLQTVYNLFKIYCNMFKLVFDRYQSFYVYNFCSILSKENYVNLNSENYYLEKNLVKLNFSQINNVIESFKYLPNLLKDVDRIYKYFIEEDILDSNENNLESLVKNIDFNLEEFNISIGSIGFQSKDTKILLDMLSTLNINDISKSLSLDVLHGYYRTLSNSNDTISVISEENMQRTGLLNKYFLDKENSLQECLSEEFYLNMISKKIQNIFSRNKKLKEGFVDIENLLDDNSSFSNIFDNLKEEKVNDILMTKLIYDKINNSSYVNKAGDEETGLLRNKTFDFIKIGFEYDVIKNFSGSSLFKIDVYVLDHDKYISRDVNTSRNQDKIRTFYYSPTMTSIPSSFYEDISLAENQEKLIGFYNKNEDLKNRFQVVTKETIENNLKLIINTSGTAEFINQETDEYRFINSQSSDQQTYSSKLGEKIFSDHYVSMFCEYYEKLINNINSQNYHSGGVISDRVVLSSFYDEMLDLKDDEFINIFNLEKESFSLVKSGESFNNLAYISQDIIDNNKTGIFMENLSNNKTDIDFYKIMNVNRYYDFFNIMIESPKNKNVTYALKVEVL